MRVLTLISKVGKRDTARSHPSRCAQQSPSLRVLDASNQCGVLKRVLLSASFRYMHDRCIASVIAFVAHTARLLLRLFAAQFLAAVRAFALSS